METPSFGVPAVNIGSRQAGRILCQNVISCGGGKADIEAALRKALTPAFKAEAARAVSPYYGGDTSGKIVNVLEQFDFSQGKTFYDGPVPPFDPQADPCL